MKKEVMFVQNGKQLASKIKKILEKSVERKVAIYLDDELTTYLRTNQIWTPVIRVGKYDLYLKHNQEFGFEQITEIRVDGKGVYFKSCMSCEEKVFLIMFTS